MPFLIFLIFLLLAPGLLLAESAQAPFWRDEILSLEKLSAVAAEIEKEVSAIPSESKDDSDNGKRRAAWRKRLDLMGEMKNLLTRMDKLASDPVPGDKELAELQKAIEKEKARGAPTPPKTLGDGDLAKAQEAFDALTRDLAALASEENSYREQTARLPERLLSTTESQRKAQAEAEKYSELTKGADPARLRVLEIQQGNAELQARILTEAIRLLKTDSERQRLMAPARELREELLQLRLQHAEAELQMLKVLTKERQEKQLASIEKELAEKTLAAETAHTPAERLLAAREARVAQLKKNLADLGRWQTELADRVSEQERRLKSEKEELESLKSLVERVGAKGSAAQLLKSAFKRMGHRQRELERAVSPAFQQRLEALQSRQIDIEQRLALSLDIGQQEEEEAAAALPEKQQKHFKDRLDGLEAERRRLLTDEKRVLFETLMMARHLELAPIERQRVLNDLSAFVRAKVFWVQDDQPVGPRFLATLWAELASRDRPMALVNWWRNLFSEEITRQLKKALDSTVHLLKAVILFLFLPILLYRARQRLRAYTAARREALAGHSTLALKLPPLAAGTLASALLPAYLLAAYFTTGSLDLPQAVEVVVAQMLIHLAVFLILRNLNRDLFSARGHGVFLFTLPDAARDHVHHVNRIWIMGYLIFFLPWMIFDNPPFSFDALPRLGQALFVASATYALHCLIRPGSPLVDHFLSTAGNSFLARNHGPLARGMVLFLSALILLDLAGFRFGATYLLTNTVLTIVLLGFLSLAYRFALGAARRILFRRRPTLGDQETPWQMQQNVQHFLRMTFILLGIWGFVHLWEINRQAVEALNQYTLYGVTAADGKVVFVTMADLSLFILVIVFTFWLLRNLSALFELLIFSRMRVEAGLRYAIIAITRYLVFIIGLVSALSWLKVDLSTVGWLAAAVSVGLGFGLQEIVANFVSGIILLIERPIRVGDTISVGTVMGKVTRVNIRSTTVLNPDMQEILIPNRDLITKEVTNWTLSDSNIRVVVLIGVAYGSDVEKVRELLFGVIKNQPEVLADPAPEVLFLAHGPSSLDFEVRCHVAHPSLRLKMVDRLNSGINRAFAEHKIEIPFAQQDLWLRGLPDNLQDLLKGKP